MNHVKPMARELGNWEASIALVRAAMEDGEIAPARGNAILAEMEAARALALVALRAKTLGRAVEDLSLSPKHVAMLLSRLAADAAFAGV